METPSGIYLCPLCGKQYYGDFELPAYCQENHEPAPVVRTHDAVGQDSYAPVRKWS